MRDFGNPNVVGSPGLPISFRKLAAFSPSDRIFLRDPRGLSPRPAIHRGRGGALFARTGFVLRYDYTVGRDDGVRFVELTGDENRIHRDGDIVAGAMTAAKLLVPLELLFPSLRINSARIKFVGWTHYGRRTSSSFTFRLAPDGVARIEVHGYQHGNPIVAATVHATVEKDPILPDAVKGRKVNPQKLDAVLNFFASLQVDGEAYLSKGGFRDYTYPLAYVASLPSAAIVKQMQGQGGMLNVLHLEFHEHQKIPLVGTKAPEVRLKEGRSRKTFRRILADIIDGVITYYRGSAVVNPEAGI